MEDIPEEGFPVPNPAYALLRRRLLTVRALHTRLQARLDGLRARYESLQRKTGWPRFLRQKKNRKLIARMQAVEKEIGRLEAELANTPREVPYRQLHDTAKQALMVTDWTPVRNLKAAAFHARVQLPTWPLLALPTGESA